MQNGVLLANHGGMMLTPMQRLWRLTFIWTLGSSLTSMAFASQRNGAGLPLDNENLRVVSAELHYPRIPREYWHDRIRKAKAMGCSAITTYVFWNLHEPRPGEFRFEGEAEVAAFVRTAGEEREL